MWPAASPKLSQRATVLPLRSDDSFGYAYEAPTVSESLIAIASDDVGGGALNGTLIRPATHEVKNFRRTEL